MSQNGDEMVKSCEVVVDATNNVQSNQNNSSNTLKSVRKKLKNFTMRRKVNENLKSDSIDDQNDTIREKSADESVGKSKITLKKIFRKSSFKKIISNIQQFTNFTVSGLQCFTLHSFRNELSIVRRREGGGKKYIVGFARMSHEITTRFDFCSLSIFMLLCFFLLVVETVLRKKNFTLGIPNKRATRRITCSVS